MVQLEYFSIFNHSLIHMDLFSIGQFQMYEIDWYQLRKLNNSNQMKMI